MSTKGRSLAIKSRAPEPGEKRQKSSDIWEGFVILKKGNSVKCSSCETLLANSCESGTSLLRPLDSNAKFQPRLDNHAARRALVMLIITTGQSLSLVEGHGFQRLICGLNPAFPISRSVLDKDLAKLYEREKKTLECIMSEASGSLSLFVDHWKSRETGENYAGDCYICITSCFVDIDWKLQRRMVGFKHLEFPDDPEFVADTVASCLSELKVDKKVMCITLDNALYDASVANSLQGIFRDKGKLLCDRELFQVHCCTEILNSVVQAVLELFDNIIDKIRKGIHYIKFSDDRKDDFYQYAESICHLDVSRKLCADLVSWDSTYKMLGCALYYKDALNHFASKDETFLSFFHLGDEEWSKVAAMGKFLKPLYDITCTFLSTKYKTANLYFLGVYKEQAKFTSTMVKEMKAKFDKFWSERGLILACEAALDPRYKLSLISYCFKKIYSAADAEQYIDRVVALLQRLLTEYESSCSCSSSVGKCCGIPYKG